MIYCSCINYVERFFGKKSELTFDLPSTSFTHKKYYKKYFAN